MSNIYISQSQSRMSTRVLLIQTLDKLHTLATLRNCQCKSNVSFTNLSLSLSPPPLTLFTLLHYMKSRWMMHLLKWKAKFSSLA